MALSPSSIIWYQRKLGSKHAYRVVHQPVSRGLAVFADAWLSGWLAEISADLRETVAHRGIRGGASRRCAVQIHVLYFTLCDVCDSAQLHVGMETYTRLVSSKHSRVNFCDAHNRCVAAYTYQLFTA